MRRTLLTLCTMALLALPSAVLAQGIGVAGRAGTVGIGAEGALGLNDALVIRGGVGLMPFEVDATIDDIDFTLTLPETWYNIGIDLYPGGGSFRIGGGLLFKPDDPTVVGTITGSTTVEIGDQTYTATDVSQLNGTLDSSDSAPYVLIGFGKHTSPGLGLFLDLGVAFLGEPTVSLSASGNSVVVNSPEFQNELRKQEQNFEDDAGSYLKLWPFLSIGLRLGIV